MSTYHVDPDIRVAATLPADFYQSDRVFEELRTSVFRQSWHWVGTERLLPFSNSVHPFELLDGYLQEPLVLTRDAQDQLHCLSNVCTHRANIVAHNSAQQRQLICLYHGRRFGLDGTFKNMPEFKQAENFPRPCEHLRSFPVVSWHNMLFTSLDPNFDLSSALQWMEERVGFLPIASFRHDAVRSKDYLVKAHWALYCDNYLEGFHIPFVHADLNSVLDYGQYTTELYEHGVLQVGYAEGAEEVFDLPPGHPDYGRSVAAYYFWIWPNMMFNFYPWGLSINIVKPITRNRTKVSFLTFIYDEAKLDQGAGALLDKVEREDEFVVEGVQRGLESGFYPGGRFSPTREQGVHWFQQMLAKACAKNRRKSKFDH